ncbi:MAG: hypothetical protein P8M71_10330 [Pseudomonadales bacterium]|nr:hypothetical protein [Pseudomonadales bacterium]
MKRIIFSILSIFMSASVIADISYNYLQVSFADMGDAEAEALNFQGSYEVAESVFVFAEYSDGEFDDMPVDSDNVQLGVGTHTSINDNTDFVFALSYIDAEIEGLGETIDVDGYRLGVGIISEISENIEVQANFFRDDLDADSNINGSFSETDTSWNVQARFGITDQVKVNFILAEYDVVALGFRLDI